MPYPKLKTESYANLGGINTKTSPYRTNPIEFLQVVNYDYTQPGSLTPVPGTTQFLGVTLTGRLTSIYEFERLSGFSQVVLAANTNVYAATVGGAPTAFKTGLSNGLQFDFVTFVDRLFAANGDTFFRYDGNTAYNFSLPPGFTASWGATFVAGGSLLVAGTSQLITVAYGYLNERGYLGPVSNGMTVVIDTPNSKNAVLFQGLTAPSGYGITAIALFRSLPGDPDLFRAIFIPANSTQATLAVSDLSSDLAQPYLWFTLTPRYLELINNQLFMGGFSGLLSTFVWSEVGEPEGIQASWRAEARTNDGDRLTGIRAYQGDGLIFKERSFHRVRANDATDVSLVEVSDQYGCLSDRAFAVFDSTALFLDRQGIVQYDGAEPKIISDRVENIFKRMNIDAARDQACAIHYKERKEVWFGIPIDGATMNNCIVVYDYNVGSWYTRFGLNISHLAMMKGGTSTPRAFYSDYRGAIHNFGASLVGDNGQGMTCLFQSRFLHPVGNAAEALFRQLYVDCDARSGATVPLNVRLYTNYGTSAELERTMYSNPFQTRIDFGLSGRSLSVEVAQLASTHAVRIHGFAVAHRFLRNV